MPSEFDLMFAADGRPQLLAVLGEDITRWPLGLDEDTETVTAIVDRDRLEAGGQLAGGLRRRTDDGEQIPHLVTLTFADDQPADDRDRWVFDGHVWLAIRELNRDGGLQSWSVQRLQRIRTSRGGRRQ